MSGAYLIENRCLGGTAMLAARVAASAWVLVYQL